ncbi:hypothetical protein Q9252_11960 [Marinobacter salarius]|uniref:hypothetical protein n=1 Tax=Marinobacter salarius TaxID=1420917 RepID=UPI00273BD0D0|nr:hypothetical protein [Marinobacter salarius]MDP4532859.1 hypothetical protein [Marinobacter salarius]
MKLPPELTESATDHLEISTLTSPCIKTYSASTGHEHAFDRVKKVNEVNRQNLEKTLNEFNEKAKAEMNGKPMSATRRNDFNVWRNGELKKVASAG